MTEFSATSADAGPVLSRVQLERLVAEDELVGRTLIGFAAPSVGLRGVDLDGVTIERDAPRRVSVAGSPSALGRVVRNLLDNAIQHAPPGSAVRITVDDAARPRVEVAVPACTASAE